MLKEELFEHELFVERIRQIAIELSGCDPMVTPRQKNREDLAKADDCEMIDTDQFLQLILSRRHIERRDMHEAGMIELVERESGQRFLIEAEKVGR